MSKMIQSVSEWQLLLLTLWPLIGSHCHAYVPACVSGYQLEKAVTQTEADRKAEKDGREANNGGEEGKKGEQDDKTG